MDLFKVSYFSKKLTYGDQLGRVWIKIIKLFAHLWPSKALIEKKIWLKFIAIMRIFVEKWPLFSRSIISGNTKDTKKLIMKKTLLFRVEYLEISPEYFSKFFFSFQSRLWYLNSFDFERNFNNVYIYSSIGEYLLSMSCVYKHYRVT